MLERPGGRRRKTGSFPLQPRHVFLGVVLLGMMSWVASGYFLSDGESSNVIYESKADAAALPEQYASLGGQIFAGSTANGSNAAGGNLTAPKASTAQGAASPAPSTSAKGPAQESSLQSAAQSALPAGSKLEQVGLKLSRGSEKKVGTGNKAATAAPAAAQAKNQPQGQATAKAAPASGPVTSVKKVDKPALVKASTPAPATAKAAAAVSVQPKPQLATSKQPAPRGLLSASRQYTVHLGSFGEKGNAENYLAQLVAAGEKAFISESTVDGRLWHRVMSGNFNSRDGAESHGRDLKRRGLTVETGHYLVKAID